MLKEEKTLFLSVFFVAATMTANLMSLRMVAPLGVVMDAGTLLYPLTFILRDSIHRKGGLRVADMTVTASVVCNSVMFAMFALTAWLPYDQATGPQEGFALVLLPGILIVIGSVVGQFVGEMIDGRIFHRVYRNGEGSHIKAALVSNAVSIPIDTTIVCMIAFGFTIPFEAVVSTTVTNVIIKYVVMVSTVAIQWAGAGKHRSIS